MAMNLSISLQQQQKMVMTMQMHRAFRCCRSPVQELEDTLLEEIRENPALNWMRILRLYLNSSSNALLEDRQRKSEEPRRAKWGG